MSNERRSRLTQSSGHQSQQSISNGNSSTIRQEIQRFESVHPSIYAIYDLIELIPDFYVAQHIRDHVVCIEDSFVNSQEWTLSRNVPDLRLGIVGSITSGKSALVHRYLTGSYMQEESPEGGRFKKEIVVDNQSHLLLIRDEGGPPEQQFTSWVDAVIFVFSLENEASFNAICNYYVQMSSYRSTSEIPIILVGTQDAINEANPRIIDDNRARKLASELKRCSYYETCATYGLNVDRVFQDACQKIVQQRNQLNQVSSNCLTPSGSRPSTPSNSSIQYQITGNRHLNLTGSSMTSSPTSSVQKNPSPTISHRQLSQTHSISNHHLNREDKWSLASNSTFGSTQTLSEFNNNNNSNAHGSLITKYMHPLDNLQLFQKDTKELSTPNSTPTTSRKNRRRSNIFTPSKKTEDSISKSKTSTELGSGRIIPLKQGLLYKKSNKPLNKEWKKKYVTLCDDGRLTYHPSLNDYMSNIHGKEISLQYVTVKVPGQKPRGSKSIITIATNAYNNHILSDGINSLSLTKNFKKNASQSQQNDKVLLTAYEVLREPDKVTNGNETHHLSPTNGVEQSMLNIKKRHRRMKSSGLKNSELDDSDAYEFYIVSLDNKQWQFEANSLEERDEWVSAIEQQILSSLQANHSTKNVNNSNKNTIIQNALIQSIKIDVAGNNLCADCKAPNPDWASLNYGILLCIECSGIHRNLGSHISKVRSLDLDEWPSGHLSVMLAIGNQMANSIWENRAPFKLKPEPTSSREKKESWIRSKYELKEFLPMKSNNSLTLSVTQNLVDAICKNDVKNFITFLSRIDSDHINGTISNRDQRTPLHLACATGNLAFVQLLIWNNANVTCLDQDGRTCLSYAQIASISKDTDSNKIKDLINLLISNGCPDFNDNHTKRLHNRDPVFEKLPSSIV